AGGGGEGMMVVVPAFAEGQDAEQEVVAAVIAARVRTAAPDVAYGIDAPGNVVDQEDARQAAPDEAEQRAHPACRQHAAQHRRDEQAEGHPQWKESAGSAQGAALTQVPVIVSQIGGGGLEYPAHVGVASAADQGEK